MTNAASTVERLPESASLLLDVMRFALAVLVVVGHMTLPFFSAAWPPMLYLADAAVPGFFVLSGFMIRYVTEDRERDPARYFISRASRMYSVLLPGIALTLVCDAITQHLAPAYRALLFQPQPALESATHAVVHLLFMTQPWGHSVLLPPNLPLWSLGYEVPYYVFFGVLMLCRGRHRWWAAGLYALLLGPQVLFLAPLWWSGCWLYDVWQWSRRSAPGIRRTRWMALISGAVLLAFVLPMHGRTLWWRVANLPNPMTLLHLGTGRAGWYAYASGAIAWSAMLLGLIASDRIRLPQHARWVRPLRRIADSTFTLYLFHFPLLCLIVPISGRPLRTGAATLLTLIGIVVLCVIAAIPIDTFKVRIRHWLTASLAPRRIEPR